ncbi:hypothetical protein ACLB2K_075074 [Fragaria x ananassa]
MDDEEMVEFALEAFEGEEIDVDYEFDAPKFFDFTRLETDWEAEEAEDWFRCAGSYPSSRNYPEETATTSVEVEDVECITYVSNESSSMEAEGSSLEGDSNRGVNCSNKVDQDTPKAKFKSSIKSPFLSRSSTLMKPTASQLAKQIQRRREVREPHSGRLSRRDEKNLGKVAESSLSSPLFDSVATKRQKLEAGYLRKVSQLKHQPLWSHKSPKMVGAAVTTPNSRTKVTIPRESNLETAQRAQRRRYKTNAKDGEQPKASVYSLNDPFAQIYLRSLHGPSLRRARHKQKSFKCFILGHHKELSIAQLIIPKSAFHKSDKCKVLSPKKKTLSSKEGTGVLPNIKQEGRQPSPRELKFTTDKRFIKEPPTDLFSKLSLAPEPHHNSKPEHKTAYAC